MEQKLLLKKFEHRFIFFVSNFYRINSIKMEKFHAGYGKKTEEGKSFIWGSYELSVDYQKYGKKELVAGKKVFHRGFSYILQDGSIDNIPGNLICEAGFKYNSTPVSSSLFPFLGRIKYIPFKITVTVDGSIEAVPDRAGSPPGKSITQEKDSKSADDYVGYGNNAYGSVEAGKAALGGTATEDFFRMIFEEQAQESIPAKEAFKAGEMEREFEKETVAEPVAADLIAMEKKKRTARSSLSVPDSGYYNKYKYYYEGLLKAGSVDNMKKIGNRGGSIRKYKKPS